MWEGGLVEDHKDPEQADHARAEDGPGDDVLYVDDVADSSSPSHGQSPLVVCLKQKIPMTLMRSGVK